MGRPVLLMLMVAPLETGVLGKPLVSLMPPQLSDLVHISLTSRQLRSGWRKPQAMTIRVLWVYRMVNLTLHTNEQADNCFCSRYQVCKQIPLSKFAGHTAAHRGVPSSSSGDNLEKIVRQGLTKA